MKTKKFNEVLPYKYYIKRKSDGLQYHGVRIHNVSLKRTPLEDFSIYYFSSGKFKKEFKQIPSNFEQKLCWTFDTTDEALEYETKINEKLFKRNSWINSCGKYIPVESAKIGRKKSLLIKYGVDHNSKIPFVVNKRKITFLSKYGVDNPSKSDFIKNKKKKTMMKRYGVETTFDLINVKQSYIKKYGVDNPLKSKIVQEKMFNTNLQRYGVKYIFQLKSVINKIHQKRKELYIKLAKMTELEFYQYLKSISQRPAIQSQKKSQRIKGIEMIKHSQT